MTNAVVLPLYFISGVFVPVSELPDGLRDGRRRACRSSRSSTRCSSPSTRARPAPGIAGGDLAVLAAWGVAGLLLAVRFFVWTPRQQAG